MTIWSKIQKVAKTKTWNKGKKCSEAVFITSKEEDEWEAIVVSENKEYEVYLGLQDEEWDCDCHSKEEVCLHICAVAIAYKNNTLKREEDRISKVDIQYRIEAKNRFLYGTSQVWFSKQKKCRQ